MIDEAVAGMLGPWLFREQALIPAHGLSGDELDALEVGVRGIDEDVALDVEDDARDAQDRGRCLLEPGVAGFPARDRVRTVPARDVLEFERADLYGIRCLEDKADLVLRHARVRMHELLQDGAGLGFAGVGDGTAGRVPAPAVKARAFAALGRMARVRDAIEAHGSAQAGRP